MAINFPTLLDTLTNPTASDKVGVVSHSSQHADINDIAEALEAKVGINGSAVTTSHDYKLGEVTGSDKAVGKTATQTLSNKTLTDPTIGSFVNSNHTHENSAGGGTLNATSVFGSGTVPTIRLGSGSAGAANFLRGDQTWSTPTDTSVPALISGASAGGALSSGFVEGYTTTTDGFAIVTGQDNTTLYLQYGVTAPQSRLVTTDWADANYIKSFVIIGTYIYVYLIDAGIAARVYRYDKTNISAGGTLITMSGQTLGWQSDEQKMSSNGTDFFFNFKAGNSANDYVISRYTLSGTTLTFAADITCGASGGVANNIARVDSSNNIWLLDTADYKIRKYNSSGTLQTTSGAYSERLRQIVDYGGTAYFSFNTTNFDTSTVWWLTKTVII